MFHKFFFWAITCFMFGSLTFGGAKYVGTKSCGMCHKKDDVGIKLKFGRIASMLTPIKLYKLKKQMRLQRERVSKLKQLTQKNA